MATKPLKIPGPGQGQSTLELLGFSKNVNKIIRDAALLGTGGTLALFGTTTASLDAAGATSAAETSAAETRAAEAAAGGAGAGAASATSLSQIAKAATTGAVLSDLISGHYLKYAAIWTGLLVLGVGLILLGLTRNGVKTTPIPMVVPA
jgi:hypothetical protein